APTWHMFSRQWIPGVVRLTGRFFAALMDMLQRGMYFVDEILRFREGESGLMLAVKGALGLVWAVIAYLIRLYVTLFVEPELNPLKHFPVVTVAHKLLLNPAVAPKLYALFQAPLLPFSDVAANAFAVVMMFFAAGPFGFLAWEFKENYRLYRATRPEHLGPVAIGPHGETMARLLVVGFHSGSIPKLYERLRRAAQREDDMLAAGALRERKNAVRGEGLGRFREGIRTMELCIRHFVERELCVPLARCRRWLHGPMVVKRVDLSSNRIRVQLELQASPGRPCELNFEEQSGYIVAGIAEPGFLQQLLPDPLATLLFENALAGLYHRAQVDLVREQIEKELGGAHYDIADEGLIVWPGRDYQTELVYPIGGRRRAKLPPRVRGVQPTEPPRVLDTRELLFSAQAISWNAWVGAWTASDQESADVSRLVQGSTLMPPPDDTPTITIRAS
ncbi:MAG TPA: hypothetical protein VFB62_16280, partial [Polyangiaceae bacterium]|nr:hypothetical protein [Polyangiaceae bacterium]